MVAIREYRITMPFTVDEYRIAQLFMIAKYSAGETENNSDGDGVEMLKNEPYEKEDGEKGQYTHKIYHFSKKIPSWVASLLPAKALMLEEEAWNAYPKCHTVLTSPYFTRFKLQLESTHLADRGTTENALSVDPSNLPKRIIELVDIGADPVDKYVPEEDPSKFVSEKTGRGPLVPGWKETCEPVMTAYKLVTVDIPYFGFGPQLETYISKVLQRRLHTEGNRKAFCWIDEWIELKMEDIRSMEKETFDRISKAVGQSENAKSSKGTKNGKVTPNGNAEALPQMHVQTGALENDEAALGGGHKSLIQTS